jgi:hypothetical protein
MTTVTDFEEYSDVDGAITLGGVALANVQYDVKWSRDVVKAPRAGARSDRNLPGKLTVTTKLKKILIHDDAARVLGYSLNDTPLTGAAEELKTGVALAADGYTAMSDTVIAAASRIRATVASSAITTGGRLDIVGEDTAGNPLTESLTVTTLGVGEYVTGTKLFKEVFGVIVYSIRSTGEGTLTIASVTGASEYTVGDPVVFDLVGTLTKGSKSITITQPNCWISGSGLAWTEGGKPLDIDLPVEMYDPGDLTVDITTA